jgi:hypothetical protein
MQINITIQTFKTENDLELSVMRWDKIKHEFMPRFHRMGLIRFTTSRISGDSNKFQLSHVFEYKDGESAKNCVSIWSEIEKKWKEKIENTTSSYRGKMIDRFDFES